jgi:hypothetical protein
MPAPHEVALSALAVLAHADDRAPVSVAQAWAKALIAAGQDHASIIALASATDAGESRTLLSRVLGRYGLADLTDIEKARIARAALTREFVDGRISATDFATRFVHFLNEAQNDLHGSDAFAREYRFVYEIDELFNFTLAQTAPHVIEALAARGIDRADPRAWVLRRMLTLGLIDASGAAVEPRW